MLDAATLEVLVTQEDLLTLLAGPEAPNALAVELAQKNYTIFRQSPNTGLEDSFGAPSLSVEAVNYN